MAAIPTQPWRDLPPDAATVFAPGLPALAEEIIEAIRQGVPEYALPLEGSFGRGAAARGGGGAAPLPRPVRQRGRRRRPAPRDLHRARAGRAARRPPLEALLAAYRLGARVAWRRQAAAGEAAGLEPDTLYLLAESIFAYIDEISPNRSRAMRWSRPPPRGRPNAAAARWHGLLVQDPPADREAIAPAAQAAGWELPDTAGCGGRRAPRMPTAWPCAWGRARSRSATPAGVCALVPDPDAPGRRAQIAAAVDGRQAALGPTGPCDARPRAERATVPARRWRWTGAGEGLVVADDHRLDLLLAADPGLTRDLAAARLAPLDGRDRRLARAPDAKRCPPGSTTRAAPSGSPRPWTCTPRPCATASRACAPCSATTSTTRPRAASCCDRGASRAVCDNVRL